MKLIGLGHYSRTGKDTLANMIIERLPMASKLPFAWKLKEICRDLYWMHGVKSPGYYDTPEGEQERTKVIPSLGMSPVELWVKFGNAVRGVHDATWIDYVLGSARYGAVVIPDVRFPNEAAEIKRRGGLLVKVVREGMGPRDTPSDRALLGFNDWDYVAGPTLGALKLDAKYLADCIMHGEQPEQSAAMRQAILDQENLTFQRAAG